MQKKLQKSMTIFMMEQGDIWNTQVIGMKNKVKDGTLIGREMLSLSLTKFFRW